MANREHSFESSIKEQIFKKVLDPFEHYADAPIPQHFCRDCGDKFIFKSSYMDHIFRDSVSIIYDCSICKTSYKFSNRCSLIRHVRSHIKISKCINMSDISIKPSSNHLVTVTEHYLEDEETISLETFNILKQSNLIDMTDDVPSTVSSSLFFETASNNNIPNVDNMIMKINDSFDLAIKECEMENSPMEFDNSSIIHTRGDEPTINKQGCAEQLEMVPLNEVLTSEKQPTTLAPQLNDSNLNALPSDVTQMENNQVSNDQQLSETLRDSSPNHNQLIPKDSQIDISHFCTFCQYSYVSSNVTNVQIKFARQRHFQEITDAFVCDKCNMYFKNSCSYKAHRRFHTMEPPFVCPECGFIMTKLFLYYKHVVEHCFHLTRLSISNCPMELCNTALPNSQVTEHFKNNHVKRFIKCPGCVIIFVNKDDFLLHMKKVHLCTNNQSSDYHYLCNHCSETLTTSTDLLNHIQSIVEPSAKKQYTIFYKCPGCHTTHFSVAAMRLHHKKCIPYFSSNYARHLTKIDRINKKTVSCIGVPPNYVKKQCTNCELTYIYKRPVSDGELTQCIKCSNDDESLTLHRIGGTWRRRPKSSTVSPTKIKKKRRINRRKKISGEIIDINTAESGISISSKSQNCNGELKCAKCQFVSLDKKVFSDHVICHKVSSATCQCMDCGMCFVTKHSLSSHLIISHSVTDTEKYIEENKCITDTIQDVVDEDERKNKPTINENQCEVCMDQFQNAADLNKHFRIHGMAFILAKQKSKTA